jgi:hypothetical protein
MHVPSFQFQSEQPTTTLFIETFLKSPEINWRSNSKQNKLLYVQTVCMYIDGMRPLRTTYWSLNFSYFSVFPLFFCFCFSSFFFLLLFFFSYLFLLRPLHNNQYESLKKKNTHNLKTCRVKNDEWGVCRQGELVLPMLVRSPL